MLRENAEHAALRDGLRVFIADHGERSPKGYGRKRKEPEVLAWQALLLEHGYAAREVPCRYGGFGAPRDAMARAIISEELARADLNPGLGSQGIEIVVPTLLAIGSEAQRQAYIAPTLRGEYIWCQGFSEPNAGSDLASLSTSARDDGDVLVLNGQKIWTSSAHEADFMHCLVRTESGVRKTDGITYLIVPMNTPGIDVRRITSIVEKDFFDGRPSFNEVFFTEVCVPKANIIGVQGQGWSAAMKALSNERGMLGDAGALDRRLHELVRLFDQTFSGRVPREDPVLVDRLVALSCRVSAMRAHAGRILAADSAGEDASFPAMVVKLLGCELNLQLSTLAVDALGEDGTHYEDSPHLYEEGVWPFRAMFDLALVIGGGSAQIQRNVIAEKGLGFPRDSTRLAR